MSLSLAIANLGVELYISGVREFELPSEENATNSTVNCICVLWLPYEDPLEIFGLQQGIRWDPILGRRCTGIAVARPCTKPGKISSLECDFTTYIHALNVARVKYVHNKEVKAVSGDSEADSDENSESEKPIENMIGCAKFEDAIKFAVEFPHMHYNKTEHEHGKFCTYNPRLDIVDRLLASEEGHQEPIPIFISLGYISENSQNSRVFRPATKWRRPMNAIGDGEYNLEDSDPIKWIGTAVLTKEDWIRSYSSGRVFPVKLLPHYQLMSMVTNYRKQILDENNAIDGEERESFITSLMSDIEKFKLNMFSSRSNQQSRIHPPDEKYDEYGIIQVQLRTFISYPIRTEGSLKPLASVYHRQDLKDQFCLASLCYIDVLLLENVPAWSDIDIWDIAHSSIHICVVWKHERRILHEGGNALELFPYRCVKINGLPKNMEFSDINTIKEKNMRMKCLFSGRVLMTPVPGSEPSIYIYMLLNGRPFSCIRNPISMRDFEPETSNHDKYFDMDRLDTNVESVLKEFEARGRFSGTLKCKVNVWPDKSRFLSRKEYSYLNLRPQKGIVYNILHDYQTKMPDHYSAPTLGPYGVWVGYTVNDKSDELINSQKFKNLFDEAIHRINSTARGEKLFAPIEDQSDDRQGFEDECGLGHNYTNPKHMVDSALEDAQALDEEYVNGDLKRFNHDRRSSKPYVPHMSTLLGQGIRPAVAGEWITFTIQSRDEDGNKSIFGNSKIHIRLRSVGYIKYTFTAEPYGLEFNRRDSDALISANESEVCKVGIDQMDVPIEWCSVESYHGVYNCRMKCERSGQYLLRITMDGLSIAGSPYDLIITPSTPEAKASSTIGEGTFKCRACPSVEYMMNIESIKACNGRVPRYINSFIVILCDEFGNRISTGGHQLKAKCNSSIGKIHKIYDNWDGSYVVYYTVHLERTIQSVGQKVIDKIHMSCNKSSWSQFRHDKLASQTTTTRAIEQALGINTRVTESKIDFNSEELGGLFNTKKIQHMTSFDYGDEEFLDSEEKIISSICDLEICVYLDNKPIYGSPFTPYIENLVEIRDWYKFVDLNSSESTERKFEKLLESDDFEGAIKLMKVLEKKYLHDFKVIIQELEREPTKQERIMDKVGKISEEQDQWTMLQKNKQKLEQIVRDNNDREKLLLTFGKFLLRRLESQMIRRQRVDSDLSSYRILKENNLEPLCHSLEVEYNKFQQQRTRELIRLVSLLETSKLNSLEELMELYQLIADELRSLGRGNLANQFDLVNRCLIEEQQLTNIRESLQRKSEVLARMDEMVTSREKALEMILSNYNEAIKIEEDHLDHEIDQIKVDVLRRLNFNPSTGVQTEDPLSFTDTVMGPLIFDRVVGVTDENSSRNEAHEVHNPKNSFSKYFSIIDQKNQDYAIIVMKTYWKPLMEWDLRCFVKILKQCPRISICLRELFSYFANTRWRNNETQMSIYGDLVHKADIGRYQTESSNNSPEMDSEIGGSNGNSVHQNSGNASQSSSENANVSTEHSKSQVKEGVKSYSKWTVGSPFVTSDDPTLTAYRKAMGITRNGFKRLIISLNLAPELIKSERTLEGLFHKYSTERTSSNVNFGNKSVRVITQELWIPLLRELAYINALIRFDILRQSTLGQNALLRLYKNINDTTGKVDYSVWENNLVGSNFGDNMMIKGVDNEDNKGFLKNLSNSRNKVVEDQSLSLSVTGHNNNNNNNNNNSNTMGSSTDSGGHISTPGVAVTQDNIKELNRVTAFRHFCELHLIPLYKQVYGSEDFSTMLMLPFSKILYSEHDEFLRGLDIDPNDGRMSGIRGSILGLGDNADNGLLGNKKGYLTSQSTHEKVECDVNNCLKIVVSQLKMNIASAIFIQLASKSMKEFEYDITRELVEFKRKSNDDDILKNYFVTEFDYIKPLHLYEYLTNVGIIPGHISGNEMHSIVEKVLSSRDEYLPKQLPVTYKRSKSLSFPGYIETLSMCIAKGIVRKLSGSLWSEGDIRTEVIEHLVLFNLYDTTRI